VADTLISDPNISKIIISKGSKKLVAKAQALIVYFESYDDLKKLSKFLHIYMGVPLKFYFGNKDYGEK
jgi:hypothetical protein